jgi:O-antigen ligase
MLLQKITKFRLIDFCLFTVGLMWVLPFLHFRHQPPLTTFDQEWWSAMLGIISLSVLLMRDYWQQPKIPRIVQLPAALIGLLLLQKSLGMMIYADQTLLYVLYLLFALLLMMLGYRLQERMGIEKIALVLALFLLTGAELSALIGIVQHFRFHTIFDSLVVVKVSAGVYGNLAQANHFANYIALGLISLGLLYGQRKISVSAAVLLAVPLLFVLTLSGSRSSWLYLIMICVLAWSGSRRHSDLRPLLHYCLLLLGGFALMHGIVQLPFIQNVGNSYDVMQRMFNDTSSGGIRLYLWQESWLMFKQAPWLGSGFGQFGWQHFQLAPSMPQANITGLYNNAHNIVFQLATEAGIAGLIVLFTSMGLWLNGLRRATLNSAHWWGYAILGVLGIHSLLEYPLWYAYFLAIAAFMLGALDETHYQLELRRVGRLSVAAMLILSLLAMLQLNNGYQLLKDALTVNTSPTPQSYQRIRDELLVAHEKALLSPYAELFMSSFFEVNEENLATKLAINSRSIRFSPIAQSVYRQAYLLLQNNQLDEAKAILRLAIWSYPGNAEAHQQLVNLAKRDPARFSPLLEYYLKTEQEYASSTKTNP